MGSRPALALLDILRGEGVDRVFGNPGTTELPFLAALSETEDAPEYVLGVHEGAVVSMADGYARGTGRPAFVRRGRPRPPTSTRPAETAVRPHTTSSASRCPAPCSPATPTTSPARTVNVTSASRPGTLTCASTTGGGRSTTVRVRRPGCSGRPPSIAATGSGTSISSRHTPDSATRPSRSTVTRCANLITSARKWVT
ncbi:hypothetical protein SCHAM137S_03462 [Streptomyces chartreusis]